MKSIWFVGCIALSVSSIEAEIPRQPLAVLEQRVAIESMVVSSDGNLLVTGSWVTGDHEDAGGLVRLWNISKRRIEGAFETEWPVSSVSISPDGSTIAAGTLRTERGRAMGRVHLWDTSTHRPKGTLEHGGKVTLVALTPHVDMLVSVSGKKIVKTWDLTTQTNNATHEHDGYVASIAFTPYRRVFVSGDAGGSVRFFTYGVRPQGIGNQNYFTLGIGIPINSIAISRDGGMLAAGLETGEIWLWDIRERKHIATFENKVNVSVSPEGKLPVLSVIFSPDGETVIS